MKPLKFLFIIITYLLMSGLHGQEKEVDHLIDLIAESELTNDDESTIALDQLRSELENIYRHPVNINSPDLEIFVRLGVLTNSQFSAIQKHISNYGRIIALEELIQIEALNKELILHLKAFVQFENFIYAPEIKQGKFIKESKNDLTIHFQQVIQKREGYTGPVPFYQGDPYRLMIKYNARFYSKWHFGINLEKDAGEAYQFKLRQSKLGFDHSSAFLIYKGEGKLKSMVLGDYQIAFAQGLTFWRGLSFSKSSNTVPVRKVSAGLRAHSGMDEFNYLRGFAMDLELNNFHFFPFVSYRNLDANATDSSYSTFSSIPESGYHRSLNELDKQGRIRELLWGAHLKYHLARLDIGISYAYQSYNAEIKPNSTLYQLHSFSGTKNSLVGLDGDYQFNNGHAFFEISRSENNAISFLSGCVLTLDPRFSVSLLLRSYSSSFQPISSTAFSESSKATNESGSYFGMEFKCTRKTMLNAYIDLYKFPWLKSNISGPSSGSDFLLKITHKRSKKLISTFRYRLKRDEVKLSGTYQLHSRIRHQIRLENEFSANDFLKVRSRIEVMELNFDRKEFGYLFFVDLILQSIEKPYSLSFRYALFNTESYDTRIYAYERDAYFTYSVRPYFYKGQKIYLNFKWRLRRYFTFFFRISHTSYPFRTSIASSNDLIEGNKLTEITLQTRIRW